jgi:hypothetical protein
MRPPRRREEPISTAITESTVQWLLHRKMNAQQQMRWTPRGAHLMLKVRCAVSNGTLERDLAVAEMRLVVPFGVRHDPPGLRRFLPILWNVENRDDANRRLPVLLRVPRLRHAVATEVG